MKKLYFSLTVLIFVALIGLGWSIDSIYMNLDEKQDHVFSQSEDIFTAIKQHLEAEPHLINKNVLPDLFVLEDLTHFTLPSPLKENLQQGALVLLNSAEGVTFHQRIKSQNKVLSMGPIKPLKQQNPMLRYLLTALFYVGIALILLLWFWPLIRAVMQVSNALKKIAQGKLDTRLEKSSFYLHELFDEVNAMAQKLELLSENNQLFSQAVSHDIRTPLSRILFALEKLNDKNNQVTQEVVLSIQNDVAKIESMSKALLHYARLSQCHHVQRQEIDVCLLIEQVMAGFDHYQTHIEFESEGVPDKLLLDVELWQKIVNNLLSNALRYSNTIVKITLKVQIKKLVLIIEDDGVGVNLDDKTLHDYCQPFVQKEHSEQHFGLGLAIVARAVKLLQGELSVDNHSFYGGARFTVSLALDSLLLK